VIGAITSGIAEVDISRFTAMNSTEDLTSGSGFRVSVMPEIGYGLELFNRHPDIEVMAGSRLVDTIRPDAFVHADASAQVLLSMTQTSGDPLPEWVEFNSKTGEIRINAPENVSGVFVFRITAMDDAGNQRSFLIRVQIVEGEDSGTSVGSLAARLRAEVAKVAVLRAGLVG